MDRAASDAQIDDFHLAQDQSGLLILPSAGKFIKTIER